MLSRVLIAGVMLFGLMPIAAGGGANRYIVQFDPSVRPADIERLAASAERAAGGFRGHTFRRALRGFTITLPANVSAERLRHLPGVQFIEPDVPMYPAAQTIPNGVKRMNAHRSPIANINGIDQRVDVDVAVIDTGIQPDHPDLNVVGGRRFYSAGQEIFRQSQDDQFGDSNGHGTHVAGIIGALDNNIGTVGAAPGARLWALKVFNDDDQSYLSDVVAAIDWVLENVDTVAVINISLTGEGYHTALRNAIRSAVAQGVVVVAAAGNNAQDIYGPDGQFKTNDDVVPAAYPEVAAISALADRDGLPGGVGSSTGYGPDDSFASFSNFSNSVTSSNPVYSPGGAIDLMMPGTSIYSTHINSTYSTKSGTSMAAPHATGLVALYIAAHGRATHAAGVYAIRQALIDSASAQSSPRGLCVLNDPDDNPEPIGYLIPADLNYDGVVDTSDLVILTSAWMLTDAEPYFCRRYDLALPPNNVIDVLDLAELARYWGVGWD